jgi:hypothetical protein
VSWALFSAAVLFQQQYAVSGWIGERHHALPAALSYTLDGAPLTMMDLNFRRELMSGENPRNVVERLAKGETARDRLVFANDGIGPAFVVYASMVMKLLGPHLVSLVLAFLALLGISTLAFAARYQDRRLLVVPLYYLGLTFMLITMSGTDPIAMNHGQVAGERYVMLLAVLPAFHLMFEFLELAAGRTPSSTGAAWRRAGVLIAQSAILIGALLLRGAIAYMLLVAVLAGAWALRHPNTRRIAIAYGACVAVTFAVVVGSLAASVPSYWLETGRFSTNVWHRLFVGMTFTRHWPYGDDIPKMFPCTTFSPGGLTMGGDNAAYCAFLAGRPDLAVDGQHFDETVLTHFYDANYERVLRDAFFKVVASHPKEFITYMVVWKTGRWWQNLLDGLTVRASPLVPPVLPFLLAQLLALAVFARTLKPRDVTRLRPVLVTVFALSLLPGYAFVAGLHISSDGILFMLVGLGAIAAWAIAKAGRDYDYGALDPVERKDAADALPA